MANSWLTDHALKNVWCQPAIDGRYTIKPARLSPPEGEVYGLAVTKHSILLPKAETWYQVFQIGNFHPTVVGISEPWSGWVRADALVNTFNIHLQFYNDKGRLLPLSLAYLRVLENGNLIIAIEMYDLQLNFAREDLYVRFYDGKFKYSAEWNSDYTCTTNSKVVRSSSDIFNFVVEYQKQVAKAGYTFAYINGYAVPELTLENINIWDYVEYFHDGFVEEIITFDVKYLPTFTSTLDKKRKYILHPPKGVNDIKYFNDIELYFFNGNDGRYYPTHTAMSLRQLTHRDYSIPTENVKRMVTDEANWFSLDTLKAKVFVRRSALDRPLIFEEHRIHELYKLNDNAILSAMTGMNAVLKEWQAAELEKSSYVRLMSAKYESVDNELCSHAYGYNSISSLVGQSPLFTQVDGSLTYAILPPLLAKSCTVYEYDSNGLLLGYYIHAGAPDNQYNCKNSNAVLIEAIEGLGTQALDITYNAKTYQVEDGLNYRFYRQHLVSGKESGEYMDITDTVEYDIDANGVVNWNIDQTRQQPIVFSDKRFLAYTFTEDAYDGLIEFSLAFIRSDVNSKFPLPFAMEKVEIWMNGRSLTPQLDFFVDWPRVTICNKDYLTDDATRHSPVITVRCRNLAKEWIPGKYGFVINGLLSNNNLFDVRDDKVVRTIVDGCVYHRDQLRFREDLSIVVNNGLNGKPYFIDDATIPLRNITDISTYVLRDTARDIDTRVEAYMTNFYPTPNVSGTNQISEKYQLFDPFLNKLIHDLIHQILLPVEPEDTNFISTELFDQLIQPYTYLLTVDPILQGVNLQYVDVQAHDGYDMIDLTPIQYSIIERANDRYLNNQVVLNKLLRIKVNP